MSQKRNKKIRLQNDDVNAYWTVSEKEKFIKAVKQNGLSKDPGCLKKISKEIGTKDANQVAYFVNRRGTYFLTESEEDSPKKTAPINTWIDKAKRNSAQKKDFSNAINSAFGECYQEEFTEVYQFLDVLLKQEYPPEMSSISAGIIIRLMTDLASIVQVDLEYIINAMKNESEQQTPSEKNLSSNEEINKLLRSLYEKGFVEGGSDITTLNPLGFSSTLLRDVYSKVMDLK